MKGAVLSLEVMVVFFLSLIPWPGPTVFKISCSRDSAKIVRKVVQSKWIPALEKHQVKLPIECPFHPMRDIFGPQHAAKLQHRATQWTCGFCGKSFYEEKYLDVHFDARHKSNINKAEDAVCLADYCDIMRCQVLISQESLMSFEGGGAPTTDIEIWQEATVYRTALTTTGPRDVAKIFAKPGAATAPKPLEVDNCPRKSSTMSAEQTAAASDADEEMNEDDNETKADENDGEQNSTAELCDKDMVDSALPPVDQKQQRISELQKLKANCNPEQLQSLKQRCELLVRDCIAGLIIQLSVNDFKEIEEEMNRAVCWYLSCDRYWEDAASSVRPFPWTLVVGIATVLTLGMCMCYYIIWVLFDSDDKSLGSNSASATAHSSPARGGQAGGAYNEEYYTVADLNELGGGQNEHYIYVTYPPELKRRLLERYAGDRIFTFLLLGDPRRPPRGAADSSLQ